MCTTVFAFHSTQSDRVREVRATEAAVASFHIDADLRASVVLEIGALVDIFAHRRFCGRDPVARPAVAVVATRRQIFAEVRTSTFVLATIPLFV